MSQRDQEHRPRDAGRTLTAAPALPGPGKRTLVEAAFAGMPSPAWQPPGAAGAQPGTGADPAATDAAAVIHGHPIGKAALELFGTVRDRPMPDAAIMPSASSGGRWPEQGGGTGTPTPGPAPTPGTYDWYVAQADAKSLSLDDYLATYVLKPDQVNLAKAIAVIGVAETRDSGIDAVTLVDQTVYNRYLLNAAGNKNVPGIDAGQYPSIPRALAGGDFGKLGAYDPKNEILKGPDSVLEQRLDLAFDWHSEDQAGLAAPEPADDEAVLQQWINGNQYTPGDTERKYGPQIAQNASTGSPGFTLTVPDPANKTSRTAQVATSGNSVKVTNDKNGAGPNGAVPVLRLESYHRVVRMIAAVVLSKDAAFFFPANVFGDQLHDAIQHGSNNGHFYEVNVLDPTFFEPVIPQSVVDPSLQKLVTSRGWPLMSTSSQAGTSGGPLAVTKYEWCVYDGYPNVAGAILQSLAYISGVGTAAGVVSAKVQPPTDIPPSSGGAPSGGTGPTPTATPTHLVASRKKLDQKIANANSHPAATATPTASGT